MSNVTIEQYDAWLKEDGPVALIIKQHLASVDEDDPVIFPPTYPMSNWNGRVHTIREGDYRVTVELPPDSRTDKREKREDQAPGYNIDRFADGGNICEIDSPQSQSNRIEPKFKTVKDGKLVPQIEITVGSERVNLLDVGHRAADAVVRMSSMAAEFHAAFKAAKVGNFFELAKYAPTSLVFGVWDSRSTYVKVQRALKAQIRATNVLELSRSAQYTPAANYVDAGAISEDTESGKKEEDNNMSQEGMKHALSTQTVGGVKLTDKSTLVRTVNLNLASIRVLKGEGEEQTKALQRYILGLALVAAMNEPDMNLREGCNLQFADETKPSTKLVYRAKPPNGQSCGFEDAFGLIASFAEKAKDEFFKLADIGPKNINRRDVIFETGVAEDYLGRKKEDRKKINLLGAITRETLDKFRARHKSGDDNPIGLLSGLLAKLAFKKGGGFTKGPYEKFKKKLSEFIRDRSLDSNDKECISKLDEAVISAEATDDFAKLKEDSDIVQNWRTTLGVGNGENAES